MVPVAGHLGARAGDPGFDSLLEFLGSYDAHGMRGATTATTQG
jgi:hypothetical protein